MDKAAGKTTASQFLYPQIDPFDQRMLSVGDGHRVYVEQCGNPDGVPVIVLHGGPGGGFEEEGPERPGGRSSGPE